MFYQIIEGKQQALIDSENFLYHGNYQTKYFSKAGICKISEVKQLCAGEYFGEVALTTNNPRSATIMAKTDLHLVYLNKQSYKKVFESQIEAFQNKVQVFLSLLKGPILMCQRFMQCFTEVNYCQNQIIWNEGQEVSNFLVLRQGSLELSYQRYGRSWIITLVEGQAFVGEDHVLSKLTTRPYRCKAISQVQVMQISQKDFCSVRRHYEPLITTLKSQSDQKQRWITERLEAIELQSLLQNQLKESNINRNQELQSFLILQSQNTLPNAENPTSQQNKQLTLPVAEEESLSYYRKTAKGLKFFRSSLKPTLSEFDLVNVNQKLGKHLISQGSDQTSINLSSESDLKLMQIRLRQEFIKRNINIGSNLGKMERIPIQEQNLPSFFKQKLFKWIKNEVKETQNPYMHSQSLKSNYKSNTTLDVRIMNQTQVSGSQNNLLLLGSIQNMMTLKPNIHNIQIPPQKKPTQDLDGHHVGNKKNTLRQVDGEKTSLSLYNMQLSCQYDNEN